MYLGDTNTVLSSVTVARCGVPVIHLEAGGRSFDWRMPEEKNRIVIDHLSDALYSYLPRYKDILLSEGIDDFRIKVIGNIIVDPINEYAQAVKESKILENLRVKEKSFILVTLHREENITNKEIFENKISDILKFAKEVKMPAVFPVMPRAAASVEKFGLKILNDAIFIKTKPLGFFDFLKLEKEARLIVSDSGTVQEEALILGTPCVIARRSTERPETIWAGATILEGFEGKNTLYNKMKEAWDMKTNWDRNILNPEGGSPSERVFEDLVKKIKNNYFETSRSFDMLKNKEFVRKAYGL
jgi:UDP-N-acetylglucosamine 2-epimerase (non-hydrolysing)